MISEHDDRKCLKLLQRFYDEDILHMAAKPPAFDKHGALWAARHMYFSLQLTVIREITEDEIRQTLLAFNTPITPAAIYSADLVLRHLPQVFNLAKGLAPSDIMVTMMGETAVKWPFSSIGIKLVGEADEIVILSHPSLRIEYADRIIRAKDIKRVNNKNRESIAEALGDYATVLWPEFHELLSNTNTCTSTATILP